MDNNQTFSQFFNDMAVKLIASTSENEEQRKRVEKIGELCVKHKVPFINLTCVLRDFDKWEKENAKD